MCGLPFSGSEGIERRSAKLLDGTDTTESIHHFHVIFINPDSQMILLWHRHYRLKQERRKGEYWPLRLTGYAL